MLAGDGVTGPASPAPGAHRGRAGHDRGCRPSPPAHPAGHGRQAPVPGRASAAAVHTDISGLAADARRWASSYWPGGDLADMFDDLTGESGSTARDPVGRGLGCAESTALTSTPTSRTFNHKDLTDTHRLPAWVNPVMTVPVQGLRP